MLDGCFYDFCGSQAVIDVLRRMMWGMASEAKVTRIDLPPE
jgi:hypothetical protein